MSSDNFLVHVDIDATVHGKDAMFFRHDCGTAESADGKYELSFGVGTGSPIVRLPDGRWVTFSWDQLVRAADAAGAAASGPACGHSACRQNWIDTGDAACVRGA